MAEVNDWNKKTIDEFRANGGRVAAFAHQPLLLLHHTGRKTGRKRLNPLAYQRIEEGFAVFASKGGAPTNPDWYYNLLTIPHVRIEVGTEIIDVMAHAASPEERLPIWDKQKRLNPGFAEYEKKTTRTIPVVILEPVAVQRSA